MGNTDLISGRVQLAFVGAAAAAPLVQDRRLRALAVTSLKPTALAPGMPTVTDSGLPGYEMEQLIGLLAPAKTPAAAINRLNAVVVSLLATGDAKEKFLKTGVEAAASSPEEFAATIKSDIERMGKVIQAAGIKAD